MNQDLINKRVSVIGLGYIGLPTACIIAKAGYKVSGTDINRKAVLSINQGEAHIFEPSLNNLLKEVIDLGNLVAYNSIKEGDIYIICVPTPFKLNEDNKIPDLSYVLEVVSNLSKIVKDGDIVILESTCPIGTIDLIVENFELSGLNLKNIFIGYCPERVLPGNILHEIIHNSRIIGGLNHDSTDKITNFYSSFIKGEILKTNSKTAEMSKLVENAFRDVNIAFANEISLQCDQSGIDTNELISLVNKHPRVNVLSPGIGVGGHCIAVDPWFLISSFPNQSNLMKIARETNLSKTIWVADKILKEAKEFLKNKKRKPKIYCCGLSYKPDIDDLRESPGIEILKILNTKGIDYEIVEPNIKNFEDKKSHKIQDAIIDADILAFFQSHKEFKKIFKESGIPSNILVLNFCNLS